MANQAMEGVLKLEKLPSRKIPLKEMLQGKFICLEIKKASSRKYI